MRMAVIGASIDGVKLTFPAGITVLEAAHSAGIDIPSLCSDPRLEPRGACRLCMVEVKGWSHPVVSCMTELKPEMDIRTDTAKLYSARKMNLLFLARNYPRRSFIGYPEKPFHRIARDHGLEGDDFGGANDPGLLDDSHTYIHVDMSQCIKCYRCVRICDEVQGQFVWQVMNRGTETRIVPDSGASLGASSCVSCGACVDTCPTGALEDKSVLEPGSPIAFTRTVCPYCGTGCEMNVRTHHKQIVQIKPVMDAPVSRGHLCNKGRYAFGFIDADDRVTEPMIRHSDGWIPVTWDEAIAYTVSRLGEVIRRYGKDSVAILGSARATNEENYLTQKFARVVLGTNNVDCCARVCHTPSAAALKMMLGTGAATNSFNDIELAGTILICGANPTENHPIVGERIKQAALRNGTQLIVIDPRRIELAKYADIHLQLRPGTNVLLLNSIAYVIIEEELFDTSFIEDRVIEFDEFSSFIRDYAPEKVARICGVEADMIRRAARLYATGKPTMCFHGLGVTEHVQGTEGVMCIVNLAILTGNIGKRGTGVNPLRGQNNVQGAAQMGCDPGVLTGSVSLEAGRKLFERVWGAPVPAEHGLNLMQMMDSARDGKLKALWTIGYDIFLTNPNANETKRALNSLDLVIIQDMFLNETAREFGHVFLPAVSSFEKEGTFMNSERRVQRVRRAIEPRGNARSDWEIICSMAGSMGKGEYFNFPSPKEIWDEIREVWPAAKGITYERIERSGLQWPCLDQDDPGQEILHQTSFEAGQRTALRRIKHRPTPEQVTDEYPFLLTTGRSLYHFNAGTMTFRTANSALCPTDVLLVNPTDAEGLAIASGEVVRVISNYGETTLPAQISTHVRSGEVFATFHSSQVFLNRVTSSQRDRYVQSPEYKITAVRIEKLN